MEHLSRRHIHGIYQVAQLYTDEVGLPYRHPSLKGEKTLHGPTNRGLGFAILFAASPGSRARPRDLDEIDMDEKRVKRERIPWEVGSSESWG